MLQTLAVIRLIVWFFGIVSSYTMGGFVHVFLVVAIVLFGFRFIQGRRLTSRRPFAQIRPIRSRS
jgi:hypothetical protein